MGDSVLSVVVKDLGYDDTFQSSKGTLLYLPITVMFNVFLGMDCTWLAKSYRFHTSVMEPSLRLEIYNCYIDWIE